MRPRAAFCEILNEKLARHTWASAVARPQTVPPSRPPAFLLGGSAWIRAGAVRAAGFAYAGLRPAVARRGDERPARRLSSRQRVALDCLRGFGADALDESFTGPDLRTAFRALALRFHPDRHPEADEAERAYLSGAFGRITQAYRVLASAIAA